MSDCVNDWLRYLDRNQHALLVENEPTTSEVETLRMPDFIVLSALEHRELWSGVEALSERDSLLVPAVNQLLECWVRAQIKSPSRALIDAAEILRLQRLYAAWSDPPFDRHRILSWLAANESEDAWAAFANIMATDPPQELRASVEALSPLWRIQKGPYVRLFPRILDAVAHLSVAAMVLDLTNYLVRSGRLATHPGHDRADAWTTLLGDVVARLESFEEVSRSSGVRDLNVAAQVTEAISLAISLTDSLTLLNHRPAMGKFYRLLGLEHRRLRVEAAAALARMEEPAGIDALQALAVEPLVRLRVHHYADELGLLDKIPVETRSPEAIAEAQLVVRLAEPDLFGVPPREWKLLDRRSLNWPGEEDPCECFLFQYHYGAETGGWTSVAIAGPICHALPIDLTQLAPESIYAVYAGASVEHSELRRVPLEQTTPAQEVFIRRAVGQLHEAGFSEIQPVFLGMVFGAIALVASVRKGAQAGTAIVEERMQTKWFPQWHSRAVDADAAYSIYLGQELLRHFNADFAAEDASDL